MLHANLTRRDFFRGTSLGAGGLFFGSFLRDLEAASTGTRPARVVFLVQGNGLYPNEIQPEGIERARQPANLEDLALAGHAFGPSMQPLQPWADKVTYLHGLSGRIARDSHGSGTAALGCFPSGNQTFGETVDAALAKRLGGIFPHVGLGVQNRPATVIYNLTSWDRGKPWPTQCDPALAHKQLFSAAAEGEAKARFDAQTNLLDFLADDVRRMNARLDGSERAKLDRYLEAFESMSGRQSALAKNSAKIAEHAPQIDPRIGQFEPARDKPTGIFDRLAAQFEVAAGALIAGLTNVVSISSGVHKGGTGVDVDGSEIGLGPGYIGSHGIGHGGSVLGKTFDELHMRIRRRHMECLAKFMQRLESIPESGGTMLDNTLIVYCSDAAESHHPLSQEWPFVIVGDLGGRLKLGGRYLRYPWYGRSGHRTVANFYLSLLAAVGDHRSTFGVADVAIKDLDQTGPLAEIMG